MSGREQADHGFVGYPVTASAAAASDAYEVRERRSQALQLAAHLNRNGSADQLIREARKLLAFLDGGEAGE